MASDRVTAATAELYGADPGDFTARRKELADEARSAGDRDAAKEITALRKPTRAAWVVNRLARDDPGAAERLADLAAGLRAAAEARDGRKLRDLSARRGELIDDLTERALEAAGVADPSTGLREDVAATLTSALADPDTAAEFSAGTLTRAAEWSGFGAFTLPDQAGADDGAAEPAAAEPPRERPRARSRAAATSPPSQKSKSRARESDDGAARRRKDKTPSRARESDDDEDRRRKAIDDAERMVASAAEAASAAATEEDRLEVTVRDLEERLTRARSDLASARTRARRAESAERKARQALDRLPRP